MLSMSGPANGVNADLKATLGKSDGDTGIANADLLRAFSLAAISGEGIDEARSRVLNELGREVLVDSAGVAAWFDAINRVADAAGVVLDDQLQAALGGPLSGLGLEALKQD